MVQKATLKIRQITQRYSYISIPSSDALPTHKNDVLTKMASYVGFLSDRKTERNNSTTVIRPTHNFLAKKSDLWWRAYINPTSCARGDTIFPRPSPPSVGAEAPHAAEPTAT